MVNKIFGIALVLSALGIGASSAVVNAAPELSANQLNALLSREGHHHGGDGDGHRGRYERCNEICSSPHHDYRACMDECLSD